jgi:asparagine synthase (glutamine-hydrolysing)
VPQPILHRSKYGFQVPLGAWLKETLRSWAQERLLDANHGFFNTDRVEALWKEHQEGRADHAHRIWLLLVFNEWWRQRRKE